MSAAVPSKGAAAIRRGFVDTSFGQVHYRTAGSGPPILVCHASPGSSKQQEPLISRLARTHRVIAPDTPGNGDSSPLPLTNPAAGDYAKALVEFLDALGVESCDAYGSHTGTVIVSDLAILAPKRIRRLVLDGMAVFSEEERDEYLRLYARPFEPDLDGTWLQRAFIFCRDQYLFFPWYKRDRAHRRDRGLPDPGRLHEWVLEVLKAATTYPLAYRAAFAYRPETRAPLIRQPTLALAACDDPLREGTEAVVAAMPNGRFLALPSIDDSDFAERLAAAVADFCA